MQIAFHIGANCTDDDRLLKSLLKNADGFAELGIKVPGPGKYRRLIRETIQSLDGAPPAPDAHEVLMDAILDDAHANRVVMSNSAFICVPNRVFENATFYEQATPKISGLMQLFPHDEIELFMAMRNPATFVPAAYAESKRDNFAEFMCGLAPEAIRWSDVVTRIRAAAPQARLTVWCNEDTPLIWAQLIREISGVDPLTRILGGYDLLASIMSPDGMTRFMSYLKSHPPQTEMQKRRVIAAFLDKYVLEDEVEETVDLPGFDEAMITRLTELYEEDVYAIERMAGVDFISP
ncbi:MAG: hypothetical protein GC146_05130 [Limimaricola sp.]|uniref:hypothetical protein n=1 Tax=Limimaricola sp. TaxID=2211665 RepID=UPI001D290E5F|nr:hypothetical protein [Limimaricola sp.]MBI1416590.1 hypothetical protein [Limimaricola sp.]